jgi:site-specific recombinase XerD
MEEGALKKARRGNPYRKILHADGRLYGKYKTRPDRQIPVEDLQAALEGRQLSNGHRPKFTKGLRDKSYVVLIFHTGARKLEPCPVYRNGQLIHSGILKEDLVVLEDKIVFHIPAFKHGARADVLQLKRDRVGIDLIIQQWQKTRKGKPIWNISPSSSYRIIKRALGVCPHWLRHNFITTMQQRLEGTPSDVDRKIMSWTGHQQRTSLDHYRMKMKKDITEVSDVGL